MTKGRGEGGEEGKGLEHRRLPWTCRANFESCEEEDAGPVSWGWVGVESVRKSLVNVEQGGEEGKRRTLLARFTHSPQQDGLAFVRAFQSF